MADIALFLHAVRLPVMPEVAHSLIKTLSNEDADVIAVRNVIARDPALTATLLRMANSAIFGLSRSVKTLESAISVVGMSQIRARAISICLAKTFPMPQGLNRFDFWRTNMICAGYARWMAIGLKLDDQQAWLTAMMLRLGELVLAQADNTLIPRIERRPYAPGERWERERALAGFDEGEITAEVASRWDFPDTMVAALRASGRPLEEAPFLPLAAIVHLAARLADDNEFDDFFLDRLPQDVVEALGLPVARLRPQVPSPQSLADISMLQN
jgi:HD-like signal output (HDOD) protein